MDNKRYDPLWQHTKRTMYNYSRLRPSIDLPSRAAWALGFEAGRRRVDVGTLIACIVCSWAEAWEDQLGPSDRRDFERAIPKHTTRAGDRQGGR